MLTANADVTLPFATAQNPSPAPDIEAVMESNTVVPSATISILSVLAVASFVYIMQSLKTPAAPDMFISADDKTPAVSDPVNVFLHLAPTVPDIEAVPP